MAVYKSKRITKSGKKYFFRVKYKDIFGVTHDHTSRKFSTREEAVNEEALFRVQIGKQEINTSSVTIKQVYDEMMIEMQNVLKLQTIKKDHNLYNHFKTYENIKINKIDKKICLEIKNNLKKENLSTNYINKILGLLKRIILYSSRNYNTNETAIKFLDNFKNVGSIKKEIDFFTYEEYKKFDSVINDHKWHTFFETLYFMGLRKGECQALNWNDIDFEKKMLKINKTLTTKIAGLDYYITSPKTSSSNRILPIPNCLINDLEVMYEEASKYKDFSKNWFVFGDVSPIKDTTIQNKKNTFCKMAKLKQIRIHDFRHSCASLLINQGASIILVSKYLGHSDIKMTLNTYTHMYKSELERITETLNKL